MNIKELKIALTALIKNKMVAFIWGPQGVGKTSVPRQIARSLGFDSVITLNLASQEVGDLVGILLEQPDGTCKHSRPDWFPSSGKHIIFLDEANRAPNEVIQSLFSFILEGRLHQHQLPEGCAIIAAGNYQNNNFITTDISDQAFMSRFCHIDLKPTVEEFVLYTESQGNGEIADFISTFPEMLEVKDKKGFDFAQITPDRRSWNEFIGPLSKDPSVESIRYELYSGIVGTIAAAQYITWKKNQSERLSGAKILNEYKSVKAKVKSLFKEKEMRLDILNSAVEEIFLTLESRNITDVEMENFKEFMIDVPLEMAQKIIVRLRNPNIERRNEILNNRAFINKFYAKKDKLT